MGYQYCPCNFFDIVHWVLNVLHAIRNVFGDGLETSGTRTRLGLFSSDCHHLNTRSKYVYSNETVARVLKTTRYSAVFTVEYLMNRSCSLSSLSFSVHCPASPIHP